MRNKKIFFKFLENISKKDKIAILSHTDLDGVASAILMKEILKSKGMKISYLDFINYKKGMFGELLKKNQCKITKIFVLDISIDSDYEEFRELGKKFDVLLIDHHPSEIKSLKGAIKTKTEDCTTLAIYKIANKRFNLEKWKWLVCATMISEFSYRNKSNFYFIKKNYPDVTPNNISNSTIGEISKETSSPIIYFKGKEKKIFDMISKGNTKELEKYYDIIEKEVQEGIKKFRKEAKFFPEKNLYFYYYTPKLDISSIITTILSKEKNDTTFIFISNISNEKNYVKVSSRNQSGKKDMGALMKKGIIGLENATAGGHFRASGARFMKKDIEKFKRNILSP